MHSYTCTVTDGRTIVSARLSLGSWEKGQWRNMSLQTRKEQFREHPLLKQINFHVRRADYYHYFAVLP